MVSGTDTLALLIVRFTAEMPAGAGAKRVSVPIALVPPKTHHNDIAE